jgi:hypothetical protein
MQLGEASKQVDGFIAIPSGVHRAVGILRDPDVPQPIQHALECDAAFDSG